MKERTPQTPPLIAPVAPGIHRPRWSVMIPAYNCSGYLRETIASVLANDPGQDNMQIEVVDDCSTDEDIAKLVQEIGKGRIQFFGQERNVGSLRNFETCLNRATGQWVHILHGDDKVAPGFYTEIERLFLAHPEAGAAFTRVSYMDEQGAKLIVDDTTPKNCGIIKDWLSQIAVANLIQPPAMVVKRDVYEKLGGFFGVHYGEDWEMWVRIAAYFPVAYSPESLACYRYLRADSISNAALRSGQNYGDILKVITIIQDYLPETARKKLNKAARRNFSNYFAHSAHIIYKEFHNPQAAFYQAKLAISMYVSRNTVYLLFKLCLLFILSFFGLSRVLLKRVPGRM